LAVFLIIFYYFYASFIKDFESDKKPNDMRKLILNIAVLFISANLFSQYFVPFSEDSIYRGSGYFSNIRSMHVDDSVLYVGGGGAEYGGGGVLLNEIGMWDNNNWHSLDNGFGSLSGEVYCIQKYNNNIYIGGSFNDIQGIGVTENIGRFNGTNWEGIFNTYGCPSSHVNDMIVYDSMLIVGGGFNTIGPILLDFYNIAAYNDIDYISIGNLPNEVYALEVYNGELYAGGMWTTLKRYMGSQQWEDIGGHFNWFITDMHSDTINNFLYVCGGFGVVDDSILTDNVAIWDGFKWTKVGYGNGYQTECKSIKLYKGNLYACLQGAYYDTIGGVCTGPFAKWDGADWTQGVPGGIKFHPMALAVYDDMLYIGGTGEIGGSGYCPMDTARKTLARWYLPPATNCNYLKPRVQTYTDTFYLINDTVTVQFYNNNAYVQTWDWDFGDTTTDSVKDPSHIYTNTGIYNVCVTVNDTGCVKTACKEIVVVLGTGMSENEIKETGFILYPNPTTNTLYVEMTPKSPKGDLKNKNLQIIDVKGKLVLSMSLKHTVIASNEVVRQSVDISDLPNGVYFVKIGKQTKKFVKE